MSAEENIAEDSVVSRAMSEEDTASPRVSTVGTDENASAAGKKEESYSEGGLPAGNDFHHWGGVGERAGHQVEHSK